VSDASPVPGIEISAARMANDANIMSLAFISQHQTRQSQIKWYSTDGTSTIDG
jgi:hypothetical protein